ncbi:Uncharacterised protein [Mycobacterium tuberculosis]|nr:Uncharacterised protein [Mycobacterium tuberculosis]
MSRVIWWVVSVSSFMTPYMCCMTEIVRPISSACSSIDAMLSFMNFAVCRVLELFMAITKGSELCSIGAPRGRVIVWIRPMPRS